MRGTITLLGAACAALLVAAPTLAAQDFHWTGKLAAGKRLEIKGVNGAIRAMATSGDQIDVTAHKTARRSDPDEVEIKVVPFEDGVAICAVYPTPRRARRENSCAADARRATARRCRRLNASLRLLIPVKAALCRECIAKDANKELGNSGVFVNLKAQF